MTMVGGTYRATTALALALAGAPMAASIVFHRAVRRLAVPLCFTLEAGEILQVEGTPTGARLYLAVAGGWQTPVILGSRSSEQPLQAGTVVEAVAGRTPIRHPADYAWVDPTLDPFRIIDGPDAGHSPERGPWVEATFRVARESDRMGIRLEGPSMALAGASDRVSRPVAPGAVQATGTMMIVLGVASGTMGGYPHVAHVISADLDRLAQVRPGDALRFHRITLEDARRIDREETAKRAERCQRLAVMAADDWGLGGRD
jgi:allophanate hydrolase subunit 2